MLPWQHLGNPDPARNYYPIQCYVQRERGREGGREGGRERGRERGREGGREGRRKGREGEEREEKREREQMRSGGIQQVSILLVLATVPSLLVWLVDCPQKHDSVEHGPDGGGMEGRGRGEGGGRGGARGGGGGGGRGGGVHSRGEEETEVLRYDWSILCPLPEETQNKVGKHSLTERHLQREVEEEEKSKVEEKEKGYLLTLT